MSPPADALQPETAVKSQERRRDKASLLSRVQCAARPKPRGSDDDELWNYVWRLVEGGTQDQTHEEPATKRRRVTGKQPEECLALQVYRRRLTGKQPEPRLPRGHGAKGHYDVLEVPRDASAAQITTAYKRRVLETHPDKGGLPEEFRRVVAAFEELIDPRRRNAYDRALRMFGRGDGTAAGAEAADDSTAPASYLGRAAVFLARFRAVPCRTPMEEMPLPLLEALDSLLRGESESQPRRGPAPPPGAGVCRVVLHRGGYRALLSADGLQISTQSTSCLSKAIDWQIALQRLHSSSQAWRGRPLMTSSADCLGQELRRALEAAPCMELSYQASISKPKKVCIAAVQDPRLALSFLQRLEEATRRRSGTKAVQKLKLQLAKEAAQSKRRTQAEVRRLQRDLAKELRRRRSAQRSGGSTAEPVMRKQVLDGHVSEEQSQSCLVLWRLRAKTPREFCAWSA
ncbi:DJA6 [Symbiodinium microadriaticum]|nr:DJA6 [Symbiodinium microadriaticum]